MTKPGKNRYIPIFSAGDSFPVKLEYTCGKFSYRELHYHNEIEFQFIKRGHNAYFIRNARYPADNNTLLAIPPRQVHSFVPGADAYVEKMALMFLPAFLEPDRLQAYIALDRPHCLKLAENEATFVEFVLTRISNELRHKEPHWEALLRELVVVLLLLVKRLGLRPVPPLRQNPLVAQVLAYVEACFTRRLDLLSLAHIFGFSAGYLSKLFKKHTGLGLKHYILQRRIIEAKKLLEDQPALKISAIAEQVGFEQFNVFNRAFKIFADLTPAAYRRAFHRGQRPQPKLIKPAS